MKFHDDKLNNKWKITERGLMENNYEYLERRSLDLSQKIEKLKEEKGEIDKKIKTIKNRETS